MLSNKEKIELLCNEINKKEGNGAIFSLDDEQTNLKIDRWTTGIEDLDNIIGGGMPKGRVVEIFGAEGSGKTTMLYHLFSLHNLALSIPIEGTFDINRAKVFGNHAGQLLIYRANFGEDALNKVIRFARSGIPLIGIDSVPSLIPREDAEKVLKSSNKDTIEEQRIGGTARLLNKYLPMIEEIIEVSGTTLILTNQVRDKINALLFGEKTDTTGGRRLKHSASLRIQMARRQWIEIPNNQSEYNIAKTEKVGMIMKLKVVKSKVNAPMQECEIPLFFDRGFVGFGDIQKIRKELMAKKKTKK